MGKGVLCFHQFHTPQAMFFIPGLQTPGCQWKDNAARKTVKLFRLIFCNFCSETPCCLARPNMISRPRGTLTLCVIFRTNVILRTHMIFRPHVNFRLCVALISCVIRWSCHVSYRPHCLCEWFPRFTMSTHLLLGKPFILKNSQVRFAIL